MRSGWARTAPVRDFSLPVTAGERPSVVGARSPMLPLSGPRWRLLTAVAAVTWLFILVCHSAMLPSQTHEPHHPHALLASVGGQVTVNVDHAHLFNSSLIECHDVFATASLPRSATTLVEVGVVTAVVAIAVALTNLAMAPTRGPPRMLPFLTGQDLLTRFCLARR